MAIVLDKKIRGKGFGKYILKLGIIKSDRNLTAMIKKDNIPSLKLYKSLGYFEVRRDGKIIYFKRDNNTEGK